MESARIGRERLGMRHSFRGVHVEFWNTSAFSKRFVIIQTAKMANFIAIGETFVKTYYPLFDSNRAELAKFYVSIFLLFIS